MKSPVLTLSLRLGGIWFLRGILGWNPIVSVLIVALVFMIISKMISG